jgi:Zn-finger nucleic acid-binding protein
MAKCPRCGRKMDDKYVHSYWIEECPKCKNRRAGILKEF